MDIEADGDLDIVLGASEGLPTVLRNNGDGTFLAIHPFAGISGMRGFAWADLDGDGNPDAAIIDGAGRLHVFMNERQGQFRERALPAGLPMVKAIAVADANNDGVLDLIAVQADGAILRISDKNEGRKLGNGGDRAEFQTRPTIWPGEMRSARRRSRQQWRARSVSGSDAAIRQAPVDTAR